MRAHLFLGIVAALVLGAVGCGPMPIAPKVVVDQTKTELPRLRVSRIAVLPVSSVFKRVTFDGENPRRTDIEESIRLRSEGIIAAELRTRGFEVRDAASVEQSFAANPELRFQATQVGASISQLESDVHARPAGTKPAEGAPPMTIGPQVASLAGPLGADAVLLVRVGGYTKSAGELAAEALKGAIRGATVIFAGMGNHIPDRLTVVGAVLIDGASGELLWDRMGWSGGDFESEDLDRLVRGLFGPFPLPPVVKAPAVTPPVVAPPVVVSPVAAPSGPPAPPVASAAMPGGSAIRYVWSEPTDCRQNVSLANGRVVVVGSNPIKNLNVCSGVSCDPVASGRIMAVGETSEIAVKAAPALVTLRCSVLHQD